MQQDSLSSREPSWHRLLAPTRVDNSGFRIDPAALWAALGTVVTGLTSTIAILYRGQIAALKDRITWLELELAKRNSHVDRLIDEIDRTSGEGDRTLPPRHTERTRR